MYKKERKLQEKLVNFFFFFSTVQYENLHVRWLLKFFMKHARLISMLLSLYRERSLQA